MKLFAIATMTLALTLAMAAQDAPGQRNDTGARSAGQQADQTQNAAGAGTRQDQLPVTSSQHALIAFSGLAALLASAALRRLN